MKVKVKKVKTTIPNFGNIDTGAMNPITKMKMNNGVPGMKCGGKVKSKKKGGK